MPDQSETDIRRPLQNPILEDIRFAK
jgi:hypothetical protein